MIMTSWDAETAYVLREVAQHIMTSHGHTSRYYNSTDRQLTRENCAACVLAGFEDTVNAPLVGPNYAGWARIYVQAGRIIPSRYYAAFDAERHSENLIYAEHLARDIETFGVAFEDDR